MHMSTLYVGPRRSPLGLICVSVPRASCGSRCFLSASLSLACLLGAFGFQMISCRRGAFKSACSNMFDVTFDMRRVCVANLLSTHARELYAKDDAFTKMCSDNLQIMTALMSTATERGLAPKKSTLAASFRATNQDCMFQIYKDKRVAKSMSKVDAAEVALRSIPSCMETQKFISI